MRFSRASFFPEKNKAENNQDIKPQAKVGWCLISALRQRFALQRASTWAQGREHGLHFSFVPPKEKWREKKTRLKGEVSPLRNSLRWWLWHCNLLARRLVVTAGLPRLLLFYGSLLHTANHLYKARLRVGEKGHGLHTPKPLFEYKGSL